MKVLLLLPMLLIVPAIQNLIKSDQTSLAIVNFKWSRERQTVADANQMLNAPAQSIMLPANKNFAAQQRINASAGDRDPNADTLDGRSRALEKSIQDSRAPKPVEGFSYRTKVQNASNKEIQIVFWEYEFKEPLTPGAVSRRQFLCVSNIKPGKEKEMKGFTLSGPSDVVSVTSLSKEAKKGLEEKVIINRVEYSDGTIWQRKGWNFGDVRLSYTRAVNSPWAPEMCKAL